MVKMVAVLWFALALYSSAMAAPTAVVIHFEPGPLGGEKIITPWGDYVAIQSGNAVWVGTEKEYEDGVARSVAAKYGLREFCEDNARHCNRFVEADLPHAKIGRNEIVSIYVETVFGADESVVARRPPKRVPTDVVWVTWIQSLKITVKPLLLDRSTKIAYTPRNCGIDFSFHHCEFKMPRTAMTHAAAIVFTSTGEKPAFIAGKSLAWMTYDAIAQHIRSLARSQIVVSPSDPDDPSYRNLAQLHKIDSEIPTVVSD